MSWTRKLSRPIGRFRQVSDVRDFILREYPDGPPETWACVGYAALEAAETGKTDALEAALSIMKALGRV